MKKTILSSILVSLFIFMGIAVNAQSYSLNPSHISSSDARGTETVLFTNNGNTSITFDLKAVETTKGTTTGKLTGESIESSEGLYKFLETATEGVSWMTVTPTSGTVAPGQTIEIKLTYNAMDISEVLSAQILVITSDQFAPKINISVNLFNISSRGQCIFFTGTDNERNALDGISDFDMDNYLCYMDNLTPIEFNIFCEEPAITSAQLSLYTWDVDETSGEVDHVYFNGHLLGALTGNNDSWSTSVFAVDPSWVVPGPNGKNLVQVSIDVAGWCVEVDWGQLLVNDCAGDASIRYVNLDATCVNPGADVCAEIEVDSERPSHEVRVEYNLLDENNVSVDGGSYTYTTTGLNDDPFTRCLTVPAGATPGSTYNVQVIVYDVATSFQLDLKLTPLGIAPCGAPLIPISNWALYIGIMLIVTFAVIRFRRIL